MPGPKMQCMCCGKVLQSMHRHDFKKCGCPNSFSVDGGSDYLKMGFVMEDSYRKVPDDETPAQSQAFFEKQYESN